MQRWRIIAAPIPRLLSVSIGIYISAVSRRAAAVSITAAAWPFTIFTI